MALVDTAQPSTIRKLCNYFSFDISWVFDAQYENYVIILVLIFLGFSMHRSLQNIGFK
jgi:hypothetical protein